MSDTVDTDIEANAILNSYMYRVLQKTLPRRSWEEWGLSTQDALDAGFNAAPTRTWLWNRTNSGSCAVNADAVVMVAGLTRLALEGKIAKKFNPQNTAEKVLIFFHDELGCDIPAIDHRIFEPNNRHDTAACLSACVESLFSSLVDKSRKSKRALRKAVENRLSSLPWKEERGQQGISVVRNRAREYAEAFAEPLHLEDDLEEKASLQNVFVTPRALDLSVSSSCSPIQDSLEELVRYCEAETQNPGDMENCFTVLSDAGSGKTSLLKALCYTLTKNKSTERSVMCIPLSELNADEFIHQNDPVEYIRRALGREESEFDKSIILLDGLDELYLALPAGRSSMDFFNKLVYRCSERKNCRFVITSRTNYIDRKLLDKEIRHKVRIIKLEEMNEADALEMVRNLAIIHGSLNTPAITAISNMYSQLGFLSVPLLLYTVAALEIDVSATKDKGELYKQIFSEMEKRAYNRPNLDVHTNEDLIRNLRLYAKAAATEMRRKGAVSLDKQGVDMVSARLGRLGINEDEIHKAQQAFILSLYTLYGTSGFLHRLFGEFLAAEDVYHFVVDGLNGSLGEEGWFELADYFFSGHILTNEVKQFFASEVDSGSASSEDIARFLTKKLIHVVIQNGVVSSLADEANDCTLEKIECVVVNLWLLIKFIQTTMPVLDTETLESKKSLLRYLLLAREDQHFPLVLSLENLSFLDLRRRNFYAASLHRCRFFKCRMRSACFRNADLREADLRFADLSYADFRGAALGGANLSYANISGADFSNALASEDEPIIVSADQASVFDDFSLPYEAKDITANEASKRLCEVLQMIIRDEKEIHEPGFSYSFIPLEEIGHDEGIDRKLLEYRQRSKYVPSTASYYVVDLNTGKSYGPDLEEFVELLRTFIDFKDGSS